MLILAAARLIPGLLERVFPARLHAPYKLSNAGARQEHLSQGRTQKNEGRKAERDFCRIKTRAVAMISAKRQK